MAWAPFSDGHSVESQLSGLLSVLFVVATAEWLGLRRRCVLMGDWPRSAAAAEEPGVLIAVFRSRGTWTISRAS